MKARHSATVNKCYRLKYAFYTFSTLTGYIHNCLYACFFLRHNFDEA